MWRIRLDELSEQRSTMQQKLSQYKALQALLEPFKHPEENDGEHRNDERQPEVAAGAAFFIRHKSRIPDL